MILISQITKISKNGKVILYYLLTCRSCKKIFRLNCPPPATLPTVSPFQLAIQGLIAHGQRMIAKQQEDLLRSLQPLDKEKGD